MQDRRVLVNGIVGTVKPDKDYAEVVKTLRAKGHAVFEHPPSMDELVNMLADSSEATDGCVVEPDGTCPHGAKSWLIEMGMI